MGYERETMFTFGVAKRDTSVGSFVTNAVWYLRLVWAAFAWV
jgi:hypothetical protein